MSLELSSLPVIGSSSFEARLGSELLGSEKLTTLQINLGLVCNLACRHCHVDSSPKRTGAAENMSPETAARVLEWLEANPSVDTVDITGGSPEMNPSFRGLVRGCRGLGRQVMDRCNPTIIGFRDPRTGNAFDWIPRFLARHRVEVVASLPCYLRENVDRQRGRGALIASVEGLRRLNEAGYGRDPELRLNLVYNPAGAHLPPPQDQLESDYRRELWERFGLVFNELWTITNMPIARWRDDLERQGVLAEYLELLESSFNPDTVQGLMCRHQIHVDSQGRLHDCDFNFALGLRTPGREAQYLWQMSALELARRPIATGDHCFGCTAGAGSSCGGSLT